MKKWLDDSLYSHKCENSTNERKHDSEETHVRNEYELSNINSSKQGASKSKMGLGVSSEPVPPAASSSEDEVPVSQCSSATPRYPNENPVSISHPSVAFIASMNSRIQVSTPCHHFSPQTVSVQLHNAKPSCSSTRVKEPPHLMTLMSPLKYSSEHSKQIPSASDKHSIYQSPENSFKKMNDISSASSLQSTNNTQGLAISLPSSYPASENSICHVHCASDKFQSSQLSVHSNSNDNIPVESSSESESRPGSASETWCGMGLGLGLQNQQSPQSDFDANASSSKNNHSFSHASLGSGVTHSTNGASNSSGCGHWCSACRVRVQVEVACVPGSQRSPNGNRRGIRTLSFPKRVRHKVKAPTKDLNGTHKKKKSPWSFRLNCRLRSNKNDTEQDASVSALNVGCVSCVCPGYRRADAEPVYRSVIENSNSTNSIALHTPMVDLSRFNPEVFPLHDLEDSARIERAREMAEGVEPPPGFIPLLRETSNSLALPLTYNSMLDLQVLLESSLRLGLGGSRTSGITYPEGFMRHVGPFASETSFLSRTVHTQVDYIHCLVPDLLAITNCGFYWGKMDRYEAERLLENRPEGTFLLRDSAQEEYLFSVSFRRYGRSLHARIEQWNHKFSFDSHDPGVFASDTVCGLIEHYKDPSCCMFFEPLLTNPLARTFPFSLQHLCRASINSKTTYDGVNNLELPKSLKNYLKEYHYKQRVRVRHLD